MTPRQVPARHRRHKRIRTSSQHQRVITLLEAIGDRQPLSDAIDTGHRATQPQLHQRITGIVIAGQRQRRPIPATHIRRQPHPVIGGIGLLTEHNDAPTPFGVTRPQSLHKPMPNHPVPDHRHGTLTHCRRSLPELSRSTLGAVYCRGVALGCRVVTLFSRRATHVREGLSQPLDQLSFGGRRRDEGQAAPAEHRGEMGGRCVCRGDPGSAAVRFDGNHPPPICAGQASD